MKSRHGTWRLDLLIVSALILIFAFLSKTTNAQHQQNQQKPEVNIRRSQDAVLYYSNECQDDINRYCLKARKNELSDLAVLQCIYNEVPDLNVIDKECHNLLYQVKKNLTINLKLDNSALQICKEDLEKIPECRSADQEKNNHLLSCILDNQEKLTTENCRAFVTSVAALVFTDYRLISNFIDDCSSDIELFKCGRIQRDATDSQQPTQQGKVIECLTLHYADLNGQCRKQITRVVELQSDDFHLDRPLYFACRDDREKFCSNVRSGNGAVYKCLMRNKFSELMSQECQDQLTRRQKVIVEDVFADKTLIKVHKCRRELRDDQQQPGGGEIKLGNSIKLANVILCLEGAIRDGDKVSPECEEELIEHRKILMTDYQLNPNIVKRCSIEISVYCGNGIERNGKTLHCLIGKAKEWRADKKRLQFSSECYSEIVSLVKIVDASEDVRVDPHLQEACQSLLTGTCKNVKPGKGRVIECLLNQLNKPEMSESCQERLLEIQFFVSRDWRLTPQIYKSCKEDAIKMCSAKAEWQDWGYDVDNGPLVLPCLYHHLSDEEDNDNKKPSSDDIRQGKLSKNCETEIRKVMITRAKSIDLIPEVQDMCFADLGKYCSDGSNINQKGEELRCLQANMRVLETECRNAVTKYTMRESKDIRLDQILMRACQPIMDEYCAEKKETGARGDLLECLIGQKNNPKIDEKCRMGIEHHQLLSVQNVDFNYKFKKACKSEIVEHCSKATSKIDIVRCLSDIVLNDTLLDEQHRVKDQCRQQLRFELLQLNENIKLDPNLEADCREEVAQLCGDVTSGRGDVLECLRSHQRSLGDKCKAKLFARDRINMIDQKTDYKLMARCREAIERYCDVAEDNLDVIGCLRKQLLKPNLQLGCKKIVIDRIMEQNQDARLNPSLWSACHNDVKTVCPHEFAWATESAEPLNGRVIKCLKEAFVQGRLSRRCEPEIDQVMREAAYVDYRLDAALVDGCLHEITALCGAEPNDKKEDCLRLEFQRGNIQSGSKCFNEVRRIIIEGAADIFIDHELSEVCSFDLSRYCNDVPPGGSQQLKCLLGVKKSNKPLSLACTDKLNSREELWREAKVSESLTGFNDLARLINQSEHKSYLMLSLFFVVSAVFVLGCFCRPVVFRNRRDKMK